MNELFLMLKLHLLNSFGINKAYHSGDKSKFVIKCILGVFVVLVIIGASAGYSTLIAMGLTQETMYVLPCMMMAVSSIMVFLTTVYKSNGLIFGFADYDMLMSLPIKTNIMVASRILMLYFMNIAFTAVVMVPSAIIYALFAATSPLFWLDFIICMLFVPIIPIVVATAIGAVITAVASRFKRKNVLSTIFTFIFLLAWMALWFMIGSGDEEMYAQASLSLVGMLQGVYPPVALFIGAIQGNVVDMLLFVGLSAVLLVLYCLVVSKFFTALNTKMKSTKTAANFKMGEQKESSPLNALVKREAKVFFGVPVYVFNMGFGYLLAIILCIVSLFIREQIAMVMGVEELAWLVMLILPFALSWLVTIASPTCAAISIEGKKLWIIKSLPIPTKDVFHAKLIFSLILMIPTVLICATVITIVFGLSGEDILFIYLLPILYSLFSAVFGLLLNLKMPMLEWKTPQQPVKQSGSVIVATLVSMAVVVIPAIICGVLGKQTVYFVAIILIAANILLYKMLMTKGQKLYKKL